MGVDYLHKYRACRKCQAHRSGVRHRRTARIYASSAGRTKTRQIEILPNQVISLPAAIEAAAYHLSNRILRSGLVPALHSRTMRRRT